MIDRASGEVRTLAGSGDEPGYADSERGHEVRFDTPCGIAINGDGTLIVADKSTSLILITIPFV